MLTKIALVSSLQRILFLLTVVLMVIFLALFIYILPTFKELKVSYAEFLNDKEKVLQLIRDGATPVSLANKLKQYNLKINELQNSVLSKGKEINFITFLEKLSEQYEMDQTITLNSPAKGDGGPFLESTLTLNSVGNFDSLLLYLNALEEGPYYLKITSLSFSVREEKVSNAVLRGSSLVVPDFIKKDENIEEKEDLAVQEQDSLLSTIINAKVFWHNK